MRVLFRSMIWSAAAVVLALAAGEDGRAREHDSHESPKTIYDAVIHGDDQRDLSTFVELLREVFSEDDLRTFFDGDVETTVFAPSNTAFAELFDLLSPEELADLHDLNGGLMEKLLRHHLTQGRWRKSMGTLKMADDNVVRTYRDGAAFKIEQATIIDHAQYKNGVVVKIDTVISPPDLLQPVGCSPFNSSHDNYLYFPYPINSTRLSNVSYDVTNCQPFHGISSGSNWVLVNAGRHDSSGPAGFFNNGLTASNALVTEDWGATLPAELNFAFTADIVFATPQGSWTCEGVHIGQGSTDATNNWWVGQPGARNCSSGGQGRGAALQLQCTANGVSGPLILAQYVVPPPDPDDSWDMGDECSN